MSQAADYSKVRCLICDTTGNWKNVDQYRLKAQEMHMCTTCGFVTYPDVLLKQAELKEFYREDYREAPGFQNICTGERKLHYHAKFLEPLFKMWKSRKLEKPVVFEAGAAFGMFLNWMKQLYPKGDYSGTELTQSFVRNAYWLYQLKLTDKFDTTKKYDLITSYKVAEHMPDVDRELAQYAECLAPDGYLYISVPTWFGQLANFGASGFTLENYYHKNHVNVWTRQLFETLLAKCGFQIVHEDHALYDDTYLCKRNDEIKAKAPAYEKPEVIEAKLKQILEAANAFDQGQYEKAIELYPDFPEAHVGFYEGNRSKHHKQGFEWIHENVIKRALTACPNSGAMRVMAGDICMRYSQWEQALKYLDESLGMKPNDPIVLMNVAQCFRHTSAAVQDPKQKIQFLTQARDLSLFIHQVSSQAKQEAITWAMQDNARIPTPLEVSDSAKTLTPFEASNP